MGMHLNMHTCSPFWLAHLEQERLVGLGSHQDPACLPNMQVQHSWPCSLGLGLGGREACVEAQNNTGCVRQPLLCLGGSVRYVHPV